MDNNNNQTIDYTEFVAAAINRRNVLSDTKIKQCFQIFDKNNDGKISMDEFRELLQGDQKVDGNVWEEMIF